MTLATLANMQSRFGDRELQLVADRDGSGNYAEVIAAALQDADAEIIGLISGAVAINAEDPPLNLVRLACDIARYRLHGSNPPEDVRLRYEDAVRFLKLVGKGEASLDGGATAPTAVTAPSMAASSEPGSRIFKRGL